MSAFEAGATSSDGCEFDLTSKADGPMCKTHGCGSYKPCLKEGCLHCGEGKRRSVNVRLTEKRLAAAQRRLEVWEAKLARAATTVVELRKEVRRYWKRLEEAGVYVHPMEAADHNDAADSKDDEA